MGEMLQRRIAARVRPGHECLQTQELGEWTLEYQVLSSYLGEAFVLDVIAACGAAEQGRRNANELR